MAVACRPRLLQLSRSADQWPCTCRVPAPCHRPLAAHAAASRPEGSNHVATDDPTGGCLASETDHPPSLAERSLRRHTPKVGAVCGKAARTVLCGGRSMKRASLPLRTRRAFIGVLGGAAAWPLAAHAQQGERTRRIGVLSGFGAEDDPDAQLMRAAFVHGMQQLGWIEGRNLQIDYRWGLSNAETIRKYAGELVTLKPDAILAAGTSTMAALLQATRTVPIVFTIVADPVSAGFVDSLAEPGGNVTGFMTFEYSLCAKWLELLKQIAPGVTRAMVFRDSAIASGIAQFAVIQSVAPSVGVDVRPVNVRDAAEIERAVAAFARASNSGLIVTGSALAELHRDLIIALAARYRLPAVYPSRDFVSSGGLISYAADFVEQRRQAATYVARILRGEKPADLPVQAPTKYKMVINLKTAKALGLEIPP